MAYAQTGRRVAGRPARRSRPRGRRIILGRVARYAVVTVGGVIFIPFLWMLSTLKRSRRSSVDPQPGSVPELRRCGTSSRPLLCQHHHCHRPVHPGAVITLVAFGFARLRFREPPLPPGLSTMISRSR